ncbi:hypothetical protein AAEX63_10830 [Luteococcus sp. H138]|uniref:hypothetical protein n=1 Tax=unclassified Luteococcus TaxID=2639923 RepID=UPI00313DE570
MTSPSLGAVLRAEVLRSKHTATRIYVLAGLFLTAEAAFSWKAIATRALTGWEQLIPHVVLYATGLCWPLAALIVALTVHREADAREGGTLWRPVDPRTTRSTRAVVLGAALVGFVVLFVMGLLLVGALFGLPHPPVGRFAMLALSLSCQALLAGACAYLLAPLLGVIATTILALVVQIVATIDAESATWGLKPWSWPLRAALPYLGTHANGVGLEPDSPLRTMSPIAPLVGTIVLVVLVTAAAVRWPLHRPRITRRHSARRDAVVHATPATPLALTFTQPSRPAHPVRAAALTLTRRGVAALTVAACLSVLLVTWSWRQQSYLTGFSSWLLIPLGTAILATISWAALEPALRITALRRRPEALARDVLLVDSIVLLLVTASIALCAQSLGISSPARFVALSLIVGEANLLVCLALTARWGTGASIGTTLVLMVTGALFGGQPELARTTVWVVAPYGYPLNATSAGRLTTVIAVLAITLTLSWIAWTRTLRRRAAQ